jgi:translation initiation factor IF-1
VLPNALYRVRLEAGHQRSAGQQRSVTAGVTSALRHQTVRLIVGDRVKLKLTTFDPNRGQITEKL